MDPTVSADCFIGLDLGTSSLKGVAVTAGGEIVARGHAPYPTHHPEPSAAEQDPRDWLAALATVVGQIKRVVPAERWQAIGLAAMIPTLVTCDAAGEPVGAAITWEDGRAAGEGDALRAAVGGDALYQATGQWLDGRYLLPMVMRLARTEPERLARSTQTLGAKDWLFAQLTGETITDPSTATGYGCYDLAGGRWLPEVLEAAAELAAQPLPPPPAVHPSATIRPLTVAAATRLGLPAGLPVALGGADSVLAVAGMGLCTAGDVAYVTGTSTVILGLSDEPKLDTAHRYLVTPLAGAPGWGREMDLLSTGSAVRWLAQIFGFGEGGEKRVTTLAAEADLVTAEPSLLPYFGDGEQGALWDPALRGSILGLTLASTQRDLAAALVAGIVLESRRCLAVLDEIGLSKGAVRVVGSGGSERRFRQALADASRRDVLFAADDDAAHSALGAALIAAQAVGASMPAGIAPDCERLTPNEAASSAWDARWQTHERALATVRRFYTAE
jgi:xylulokinase